ncbi:MAG: glycosyltransferase family 4 protein [Syntrophobacteraceae bacterium]|nr:glycosyltransferase family 4 protein [Syntrophobacteraceae bacterium]
MNVRIISCWFATSYGASCAGLRSALEKKLGREVGIITSNCGCGDPVEKNRVFYNMRCDYFEFPHITYYKSSNLIKYELRNAARRLLYRERARRYLRLGCGADLLHFQQILNAFGSVAVFNWLSLPSKAARVVTVHELDPYQVDRPKNNLNYNKADRVIVHSGEIKDRLVAYGVHEDIIDIVGHGVEVRELPDGPREGIIYYAGHKMASGKGFETLLKALALVKSRIGPQTPRLRIHGHYGTAIPEYGLRLVEENGLKENVQWLNQISVEQIIEEYQKAMICTLPYTASFAGMPAVTAMANGVPVIATRRAGLPEHLGDAGVWMEDNDVQGLADSLLHLLGNESLRRRLAMAGRQRAERMFSWDIIAESTLKSYQLACQRKCL